MNSPNTNRSFIIPTAIIAMLLVVPLTTLAAGWGNMPFTSQGDTFTAAFDATPNQSGANVVIGLSNGAADAYTDLGPIVIFKATNAILVRNGGAEASNVAVSYTPNTNYHFRMVVNVPAHTYSVYVTPQGGSEIAIASNYAFRTEQAAVALLNNVAVFGNPGDAPVLNFSTNTVTASFFGMHFGAATSTTQWPASMTTGFLSVRIWGASGANIEWRDVNPAPGQYYWTELDAMVALAESTGVDLVYTLAGGYSYIIPSWIAKDANGMPNLTDWRAFVTAITTRYNGSNGHGRIKYWEVWNEPNNDCNGATLDECGAKLVPYGQAVHSIAKAANHTNLVLSPSPQGSTSASWLDSYFKAGGIACTDIIAFHGYIGAPENIVTVTQNVKNLRTKYPALASKPIWDTEHSWGTPAWTFGANDDQQAAWVARFITLSFSSGISRSFWYTYAMWEWSVPDYQVGTLFTLTNGQNRNIGYLRKPGIAYNQVYGWLIGANMDTCIRTGTTWSCRLARTGYEGLIVWSANSTSANPTGTSSYTVPAGYTSYKTLDGATMSTSPGSVLTIGMKPILLEKWTAFGSWIGVYLQTQNGLLDDPDHDGMSNMEEYLWNLRPNISDAAQRPVTETYLPSAPATLRVTYRPPVEPRLLLYVNVILETSTDLTAWSPVEEAHITRQPDGSYQANIPAPGSKLFTRFRIVAKP